MNESRTKNVVRTTETTLDLVDELIERDGARIDDLSQHLDLAPSTVHRHLETLRKRGYVVKEAGVYRVGLRFLTIGGIARNRQSEGQMVENYVEQLAEETGERAQFVVEETGQRVFLYRRVGENAVLGDGNIGKRGELHCSSAGKAILAEFSDERVREVIDRQGLPAYTENTITDSEALFEELETIRDQGYSVNREESAKGFHAVGVSVTSPDDNVLGALSVSGPAHRLNEDRINDEIPDIVRGTAQELELKIEYY